MSVGDPLLTFLTKYSFTGAARLYVSLEMIVVMPGYKVSALFLQTEDFRKGEKERGKEGLSEGHCYLGQLKIGTKFSKTRKGMLSCGKAFDTTSPKGIMCFLFLSSSDFSMNATLLLSSLSRQVGLQLQGPKQCWM